MSKENLTTNKVIALLRDDYTCQHCGRKYEHGNRPGTVQVHHIIPHRRGGSHALDNLLTLCYSCHRKADRSHWIEAMRTWQSRLGNKNLTPLE